MNRMKMWTGETKQGIKFDALMEAPFRNFFDKIHMMNRTGKPLTTSTFFSVRPTIYY